ncbi:MAG: hypothetical protein K6C94_08130 [Candidatus Gastranaerophilales bacterium]|nr:hypothetical protein [Candidatus Gastranaerophilales bacterium]
MILFLIGILILVVGYLTYSKYVDAQFEPQDKETAATQMYDGVDYVPLPQWKNMIIHLMNIAGMGPVLAAIQGVLFGPWVFIIVPLGCIFMGAVHDYMCGMISVRTGGLQLTGMIKKFLGYRFFQFFMVAVTLMSFVWVTVFVYSSGDIFMQRFLHQTDFSFNNPVAVTVYCVILLYFLIATLFPIDKFIGKVYPIFAGLFLIGTFLLFIGFFSKGLNVTDLTLSNFHVHPKNLGWIPFFFLTVSCGLLSGSHATQAPIIARTVGNERQGRKVFYAMMCGESVIMMIWALAAMSVYNLNLVPENLVGTANVVNIIADHYAPLGLGMIIAIAVLILPITSGDTALRSVRLMVSEALNLSQKPVKNRFAIIAPSVFCTALVLIWAKTGAGSFSVVWRYTMFINQLIAIPTLLIATIFLYRKGKNYFMTLIPLMFYTFILTTFILNAKIGFNVNLGTSEIIGLIVMSIGVIFLFKKLKNDKAEPEENQ